MLDRAEAAYAEAIHARPLNLSVWEALARLQVERGHLDRAAATIADALRIMPDDLGLRMQLSRALLWSGDRSGWRRSNDALHDQFGRTSNAWSAMQVSPGSACWDPRGLPIPRCPSGWPRPLLRVPPELTRRTI